MFWNRGTMTRHKIPAKIHSCQIFLVDVRKSFDKNFYNKWYDKNFYNKWYDKNFYKTYLFRKYDIRAVFIHK